MKQTKTLVYACRELKRKVRYETADFPDSLKERTKLYTETWIIPIIDAIEAGDTSRLKSLIS